MLTLHLKATILKMRKFIFLIPLLLLASCGEYNKVLKSNDIDYKFDYAKRAYVLSSKGNSLSPPPCLSL